MLDEKNKVQGVGVYAEFRKEGEALQLLITPDALNSEGKIVPMAIHRRMVTKITPKSQWRITRLGELLIREYLADSGEDIKSISIDEITTFTANRFRYAMSILDDVLIKGWTITKSPILIEVSKIDADDIGNSKTPNKVLHRVGVSKKSLGFPEELI